MKRLRFVLTTAPRVSPKFKRTPDAPVSFAPMDALSDGLGGLSELETKAFSEVAGGSYNYFEDGDVLLAKVTPCFENGKKAIARDLANGAGFATSEVLVFRPDSNGIDTRYLRYMFCSEDFRHKAIASMTGAGGLRRVSERAVLDFPFRITDLATQRQIADFLDRETARIDLLIEKKQRFVECLSEKRFAETSSLLTGELFRSEDQKECSIGWIPSIPTNWQDSRMKNVCTRIIDCKNRTPDEIEDGEFLVVRTSCVRNGKFIQDGGYYTDESSYREWTQRGKPQKDDVIFTREAPVGEACIAPEHIEFCLGQRTMIYRPDPTKVLPEYIIATIYSSIGKSYIGEKGKGSTVGHLRVPEVYNFPCILPPFEAQRRILSELNKRTGHFDDMERATNASIDRLKEYRSALITAAVTGQIDMQAYARSGTSDRQLDTIQEEMGE